MSSYINKQGSALQVIGYPYLALQPRMFTPQL